MLVQSNLEDIDLKNLFVNPASTSRRVERESNGYAASAYFEKDEMFIAEGQGKNLSSLRDSNSRPPNTGQAL